MADHLTSVADEQQTTATLNQVDAILAVEVFTDAFNKFQLLDELAPDLSQHKDAITVYVGKEIERIIRRQEELESEFQLNIQRRDEAISLGEERKTIKHLNDQVQELAQRIQDSTKELCRNLKENPSVSENLVKTQTHRSDYKILVQNALQEFKQKNSYYELEHQISSQFSILQEHDDLQKREKQARKEVEELQNEIKKKKEQHEEFMNKNLKDLSQQKEDLQFEKERVRECLNLLQTELKAGGDEMKRIREAELNIQHEKLNNLIKQTTLQQKSDEILLQNIQKQTEEMSKTATEWNQKKDYTIKLLENEKSQLEKERQDKADEIKKLEDLCNRNKAEKKQWEENQAFQLRMKNATLEARKMRMEISRAYVQATFVESLCVTKKKKGKGKK
ncbi:Conserved_hypothetical protein [Hexamita inflata]|uniref:Dynein regulatory complex protein 9 n=1 Tax=Hexamita inflata TaxID=28002 RepID=A0AA86PQ61_9EUKA|nr:Conserved hypothetical protein [Hexamita inflata]CAI9963647.1 Conserved hypothetical protein [Hexamita inflata]